MARIQRDGECVKHHLPIRNAMKTVTILPRPGGTVNKETVVWRWRGVVRLRPDPASAWCTGGKTRALREGHDRSGSTNAQPFTLQAGSRYDAQLYWLKALSK